MIIDKTDLLLNISDSTTADMDMIVKNLEKMKLKSVVKHTIIVAVNAI